MLHYILQIVCFQMLFLLVYEVFLRRQTFFIWNRLYLIGTSALALVLPFLKLDIFSGFEAQMGVISLPQVVLGEAVNLSSTSEAAMEMAGISVETASTPVWQWVLLTGSVIFALGLVIKGLKLARIASINPKRWQDNILLISLKDSVQAYSFFNTIFIGTQIHETDRPVIMAHEMVHVRHKHSLDILWFQLMRILFWFNPAVYWYHNRIVELHEYTADQKIINSEKRQSYYENLLKQALGVPCIALTNAFFTKKLLKKRLKMMHQSPTQKQGFVRYLLVVPLVLMMLGYVSCEKESIQEDIFNDSNLEQYTFTIDISDAPNGMTGYEKQHLERFESFLRANPGHVAWMNNNLEAKTVTYSMHTEAEIPDFKFHKGQVTLPDGFEYELLMNLNPFMEEGVIKAEQITNKDVLDQVEVPYAVIEKVPAFESCDHLQGAERRKCTSMEVSKFVNRNFDTSLASQYGLVGRQRISVFFKIDNNGDVIEVGARAPHPALEEEAKRVINLLPQFIPGEQKGKQVTVPYSLPILFQVQG